MSKPPPRTRKATGRRAPSRRGADAKPARGGRAPSRSEGSTTAVRLQKYLAHAGIASRRKAEELIEDGQVAVNGKVVRELGTRVEPGRDRVALHGKPVQAPRRVYYLLNKPDGVVCAAQGDVDDRGRPTVLSLLRGVTERVYPVGRLDYHSRGLILLTNDGDLAAALTHPRHGVVKVYHVKFQGRLDEAAIESLRSGVRLEDGTVTRPATELLVIRETEANTWIQLGISQGLNRQIRRMGEAIGHAVLKLIRVGIDDLTTDGLDEGEFRTLSTIEVERLRAHVGRVPAAPRE
ncbi:MAG: rRNA pseudouridine synthase [Myxococcales bacterium FL481]|nr:MAG: rRNA pseudouridine synthase [Myxococcales bacterium FL481]